MFVHVVARARIPSFNFCVVLEFELRASYLLGRCCIPLAMVIAKRKLLLHSIYSSGVQRIIFCGWTFARTYSHENKSKMKRKTHP
jgi:hypothetical protein